jgi:hypothetical protein
MKFLRTMTMAVAVSSAALTGLILTQATPAVAANAAELRLQTKLTGGAINNVTPEGEARFRQRGTETSFKVEAEHVSLPDGTVLPVTIDRAGVITNVGTITLSFNEGELELKNALAPIAQSGDIIIVSDANNTPLLTGVLK